MHEVLTRASFLTPAATLEAVRKLLLGEPPVKDLLEFSRSVHAEMEAMLSVARTGGASLRGGVLYTTTFPCHNCARHIVASGIETVLYVEPYAKSKAEDLHSDAISWRRPLEAGQKKVRFLQYQGFAPRVLPILFSELRPRKEAGKPLQPNPRTQMPKLQPQIDSFVSYEHHLVLQVGDLYRREEKTDGPPQPPERTA